MFFTNIIQQCKILLYMLFTRNKRFMPYAFMPFWRYFSCILTLSSNIDCKSRQRMALGYLSFLRLADHSPVFPTVRYFWVGISHSYSIDANCFFFRNSCRPEDMAGGGSGTGHHMAGQSPAAGRAGGGQAAPAQAANNRQAPSSRQQMGSSSSQGQNQNGAR